MWADSYALRVCSIAERCGVFRRVGWVFCDGATVYQLEGGDAGAVLLAATIPQPPHIGTCVTPNRYGGCHAADYYYIGSSNSVPSKTDTSAYAWSVGWVWPSCSFGFRWKPAL